MNVYFDFNNFLSFIHSAKDTMYDDCMRMLKDNFDIIFTFSKKLINEAGRDDQNDIMQWFTTMSNGAGNIYWESEIPHNPINKDELLRRPYIQSVYCLDEKNRDKVELFADKGLLEVSMIGDELKTLSSLFVYSNQYIQNIFEQINRWEDIKNYTSHCTDIIIVDQYLLSSPSIYFSNIYKLIKCLAESAKNDKINIVIITLKKQFDKLSKIENEPDWNTIYSELREYVNKKCRPNITFVVAAKENFREHDRTIFTNYKLYASGDTYNYFDNNGNKITKGRYLHIHSLADTGNMVNAHKFLDDMQKLIDKTKVLNNSNIMKDKKCNFLKFD